jgi:hypothetical protein
LPVKVNYEIKRLIYSLEDRPLYISVLLWSRGDPGVCPPDKGARDADAAC